jgi:hypothetical protein
MPGPQMEMRAAAFYAERVKAEIADEMADALCSSDDDEWCRTKMTICMKRGRVVNTDPDATDDSSDDEKWNLPKKAYKAPRPSVAAESDSEDDLLSCFTSYPYRRSSTPPPLPFPSAPPRPLAKVCSSPAKPPATLPRLPPLRPRPRHLRRRTTALRQPTTPCR